MLELDSTRRRVRIRQPPPAAPAEAEPAPAAPVEPVEDACPSETRRKHQQTGKLKQKEVNPLEAAKAQIQSLLASIAPGSGWS